MKFKKLSLLLLSLTFFQGIFAQVAATKKMLIYTKNGKGYVHENIATSVATLQKICDAIGVETLVSDDPKIFTDPSMNSFDGVFFSNTNNEAFDTEEQKAAFQAYCRSGKGFAGLHSAVGSERQWPWYWSLIGGTFIRHAPFQEFTVRVIDKNHSSTQHYPARFEVSDECYYNKELNPDIHVLLAADMTTVEDKRKGEYPSNTFQDSFPIAWYHTFEGGRQWYSSLGHSIESYADKDFQDHLKGGIQYILNLSQQP
ncbi:MAG: ThuA domain-containing protein [Flavobacteriaceae bacterium]|jgi:uncharacterized protein|nr:ThuA domain-containing protein [Flavobacteriaceae bacterium]